MIDCQRYRQIEDFPPPFLLSILFKLFSESKIANETEIGSLQTRRDATRCNISLEVQHRLQLGAGNRQLVPGPGHRARDAADPLNLTLALQWVAVCQCGSVWISEVH